MAFSTILSVLSGESGGDGALASALALGHAFEARVTALHVAIDPERSIPLLGEGMTGSMIADLTASLEAEATRNRDAATALFDRLCRGAGLPVVAADAPAHPGRFTVALECVTGVEPDQVAERGRLNDLIIVPRMAGEEGISGPTLEAALFETGRPVLLATLQGLHALPERMAVAWNGRREAARAVAAALPLLKRAQQVTIITGEGRDDRPAAHPSALAGYLAHHGIAADTWLYQPDDWPVGLSLVTEAKKAGAGLLVMGAYGHSRLREVVLGGATRAAMKTGELALFMAH